MSHTCLNLHSAADFTETHIAVRRYRKFIRFSALQAGEFACGIGWVTLLNLPHAVWGSGHIELHSLDSLPVQVRCIRSTLQVHSHTHRFAWPYIKTALSQGNSLLSDCMINANLLSIFRSNCLIHTHMLWSWHLSLLVSGSARGRLSGWHCRSDHTAARSDYTRSYPSHMKAGDRLLRRRWRGRTLLLWLSSRTLGLSCCSSPQPLQSFQPRTELQNEMAAWNLSRNKETWWSSSLLRLCYDSKNTLVCYEKFIQCGWEISV